MILMANPFITEGTGNRDKDAFNAGASVLNQAIASGEGIIKSLMQASMSNPLMGVIAAIITLDILYKQNVISSTAYWSGLSVVIAGAGISLVDQTLKALEDVLPFAPASQPITQPSGQVLVFGDADQAQLNALLSKFVPK